MKCPKCNMEISDDTKICPGCGFSFEENTPVVDAPVVEAPVVEAPAVEAPVVEAPAVEAPVVDAPVVEAPVVDAPVVEAPVVDAPAVDAPAVEAPAVETPAVEAPAVEAPVVDAPVVEAPVVDAPVVEAPVVDAPAVEAPAVEAPASSPSIEVPTMNGNDPVLSTPSSSNETPVVKEKRNILVYIVIGILGIIAIVLFVLLIINGPNSATTGVKDNGDTDNKTGETKIEEKKEEKEEVSPVVVTLHNVVFQVPEGFEVDNSESFYTIFNTKLRKIFVFDDLYTGTEDEITPGLNTIKASYATQGCTDIVTEESESDGIKYGLVTYMYDGILLQELYAVLNNQYILAFFNLQTDLVSTDEFINYAITTAKTGKEQGPVFGTPEEPVKWDYNRKNIESNFEF